MTEIPIEDYLTCSKGMLIKHEGNLLVVERKDAIPFEALAAVLVEGRVHVRPIQRGDTVLGQVVARIRPSR